ncbi:hypothetical protein ACFL6C_01430 [Myxococcota bacterium]
MPPPPNHQTLLLAAQGCLVHAAEGRLGASPELLCQFESKVLGLASAPHFMEALEELIGFCAFLRFEMSSPAASQAIIDATAHAVVAVNVGGERDALVRQAQQRLAAEPSSQGLATPSAGGIKLRS